MEQCEIQGMETPNIFECEEPRLKLGKISLSDKKLFENVEYIGLDVLNSTLKILESFKEFDLEGGIVWNNNVIQAFCIYEKVTEDSIIFHVELNDNSHRGLHTYMR